MIASQPVGAVDVLLAVREQPGLTRWQLHELLGMPLREINDSIQWLEQHELVIHEEPWR